MPSPTYISDMGTISSNFLELAPYFTYAAGIIDVTVLTAWFYGWFEPVFMVWFANLFALLTALGTAAWVAVKTVDASVDFANGYAHVYRNHTTWERTFLSIWLGLWELIGLTMFLGWSMFVTVAAFDVASYVVDLLNDREKLVAQGKYGQVANFPDSLKFATLLFVQAVAVWVSGYSLASNVDEIVDYFDHYADKVDKEADTKTNSDPYVTGSAIEHDLFFHGITGAYSWVIYTFIMVGGYYFAWHFGKFYPVSEDTCDVSYDASDYASFNSAFAAIPDGTYDQCLSTMKSIFNMLDKDNNGQIDRCEDAKFLLWANDGNKEYAMNYAGYANLADLQHYCQYMVIDAFDRPMDSKTFWMEDMLSRIVGMWPINLFFDTDNGVVNWYYSQH